MDISKKESERMLWRWRNTIMRFMQGRYGTDKLNSFLFWTYLVIWVVGLLFRGGIVSRVLSLVATIIAVVVLYRTLSRNIVRRQAENERFLRLWTPIGGWFRRQFLRVRDIRRWRYRQCPRCSANLRLPVKRGRRTVTCARCNSQFKAFFL